METAAKTSHGNLDVMDTLAAATTTALIDTLTAAAAAIWARPEEAAACFTLAVACGLAIGLTCVCGGRCARALLRLEEPHSFTTAEHARPTSVSCVANT